VEKVCKLFGVFAIEHLRGSYANMPTADWSHQRMYLRASRSYVI
jgi:hypothetical protein